MRMRDSKGEKNVWMLWDTMAIKMTKRSRPIFHLIGAHSIPNGTKFIAIYGDGSGAGLFVITDDGDLWDGEGEKIGNAPYQDLMDRGYNYWMQLPSGFKLWFERQ